MSACNGFSQCRIQFTPNDQQRAERNYSDRSIVELRQYDFANYSLRALDIDNDKKEIFNIPLEKEAQYKRGKTVNVPDEIHSSSGTYRLWLNASSRTKFYEALNMAVEELKLLDDGSPQLPTIPSDVTAESNSRPSFDRRRSDSEDDNEQRRPKPRDDYEPSKSKPREDRDKPRADPREEREQLRSNPREDREQPKFKPRDDYEPSKSKPREDRDKPRADPREDREQPRSNPREDREQPRSKPREEREQPRSNSRDDDEPPRSKPREDREQPKSKAQLNRNDILADVYQLGQHIRQGHSDDAVDLARKLSKKRLQLQANLRKQQDEEKSIQIRVKIDSNDAKITKKYDELTMAVYPSTTIRELRAAFEYSVQFPPSNQYFFVNGHLAHENSTMKELDIHPDVLFVLFIIQQ